MGGQILGGGVIVLVAAVLWLVYLLPSWHSRYQYDAAERNAVRLSQALRILAETSETPQEVRLELNARTALAQQKLARRVQAERDEIVRRTETERTQAEIQQARAEAEAARELARARAAAAQEAARAQAQAARSLPAARRARARRRARLLTTLVGVIAIGFAGWGAVEVVLTGTQTLLWSAVGVTAVCGIMLQRMAHVARRASGEVVVAQPVRVAAPVQDLAVAEPVKQWTPRELPRPLASSTGSRASAVLDAAAAREALRHAALEESVRARAEQLKPTSIEAARAARAASEPEFSRMGYVDDAEIEAHVRQLLQRRASGE